MPSEDISNAIKPEEAQAQAAEYLGVTAGITFDLGDDKWTLPNPAFLTPEQRKRHKEHQKFMKTMDKETVPHPIIDGKMIEQFVYPYELKGELVDEDELLCIALMGKDVYEKFVNTGGAPGQIAVHWNVMNRQLQKRLSEDSKSI